MSGGDFPSHIWHVRCINFLVNFTGMKYLVIGWTDKKVAKCLIKVLAESWTKDVLFMTKLVPRLAYYRVNHVQPWYLVFWSTLQYQRQRKKI